MTYLLEVYIFIPVITVRRESIKTFCVMNKQIISYIMMYLFIIHDKILINPSGKTLTIVSWPIVKD